VRQGNADGRAFTEAATSALKRELARLVQEKVSPTEYRAALLSLGRGLGMTLKTRIGPGPTAIVTTPEDADFLTRGTIEGLALPKTYLACYWTTRVEDSATVHQQYVDPAMPRSIETVIIVKSIISSGCIVRTNLAEFLTQRRPKAIFIVAPVMLRGADEQLRTQFSKSIANRFTFVTCAIDSRKQGQVVVPGVGGMVEKRLGLRGRIAPHLIGEWREKNSQVSA
jgi:hypothetical protein